MPTKLKQYDEVPTGFEIVDTGPEEIRRSLWFNATFDESSEGWDKEIQAINRMQEDLGPLGDEARLVRAQIAAFARCSYTFPESVDVVLESTAAQRPARPRFFVGCKCDLLSFFNGDAPPDQKERVPPGFAETLRSYIASVLGWLGRDAGGFGEPNPGTAERVAELLGPPTDFKKTLADYLLVALVSDCSQLSNEEVRRLDRLFKERTPQGAGSLSAYLETLAPAFAICEAAGIGAGPLETFAELGEDTAEGICFTQHAAARALRALRAAGTDARLLNPGAVADLKSALAVPKVSGWWTNEFAQKRAGLRKPLDQILEIASRIAYFHNSPCHKKYFRHVAILLSSIGEMRLRGSIERSGKDALEANGILLDYLSGLNAWLGSEAKESMLLGRARDRQRAERVFEALGEATPTKRWLAACLWKTLKSGHSWNRCIELDRNSHLAPASWLKAETA